METLTVFEKYSRYWPSIALTSAVLSVIFFGTYWYSNDVLIAGYLRLAAFIFFALSLLSFFKWKDGQVKIDLNLDQDQRIKLNYFVRDRFITSDHLNLDDVSAVEVNKMPNKTLYNEFATGDRCIRFRRKDTGEWSYLNKVHGRIIPLNTENANRVTEFINAHLNRSL